MLRPKHAVRRLFSASLGALCAVAVAGILAGPTDAAAPSTAHAPATPAHVMVIMMENTDYSQFAGSPAMPRLVVLTRSPASRRATPTSSHE